MSLIKSTDKSFAVLLIIWIIFRVKLRETCTELSKMKKKERAGN